MQEMKKILITNDDGILAPGIRYLWSALKDVADVKVVAPLSEQSATGLSITIRSPLRLEERTWPSDVKVWSVDGTPADCIKLALHALYESPPDLIVSGVNRGNNAGRNILYSGTVAGVIEGVLHDIPGIAFSCQDYTEPNFEAAATYVPRIVNHVLNGAPLPSGSLLNVNFPGKNGHPIQGFKYTKQGKQFWTDNPDERSHPVEGHRYFWLGAQLATYEEDSDSDISWLEQGYVTATPIHIAELTDHDHLVQNKKKFENLFTLDS